MTYPIAVCAVLMQMDGSVLCVSRRNNSEKWGLPGGKLDGLETPIQAVIREVYEETGFTMDELFLSPIYTAACEGEVTYNVVTFFYDAPGPDMEDLTPEEGLSLEYKDFALLTEEKTSPFSTYNLGVLTALARNFVNQLV